MAQQQDIVNSPQKIWIKIFDFEDWAVITDDLVLDNLFIMDDLALDLHAIIDGVDHLHVEPVPVLQPHLSQLSGLAINSLLRLDCRSIGDIKTDRD